VAEDRKTVESISRNPEGRRRVMLDGRCGLAAISLPGVAAADAERLLRHDLKQSVHLPRAWRGRLAKPWLTSGVSRGEAAVRRLLKIEPKNQKNGSCLGKCAPQIAPDGRAIAFRGGGSLNPTKACDLCSLSSGRRCTRLTATPLAECEEAYKGLLRFDPISARLDWSLAD